MNILLEWLGDGGKPVDQALAESRAKVCEACPENVEPKWWERMSKEPIAAAIREHLEVKNGLGIKTSRDEQLNLCGICGCCLPLKCWVPIKHISNHTEDFLSFPDHCWIRKELNT